MENESKIEAESGTEGAMLSDNVNDVPMIEGVNNPRKLWQLVNDGKSLIGSGRGIFVEDIYFRESDQPLIKVEIFRRRLSIEA